VVGRVGQRLLVARHPGGEHRLAERLADGAVRVAGEGAPVLENQHRAAHAGTTSRSTPSATVGRPRNSVATTRAGSVCPANGVLRDRDASESASTVQAPAGSISVRFAGAPTSSLPPCPATRPIAAG